MKITTKHQLPNTFYMAGVQKMSHTVPGLVETSSNVGSATFAQQAGSGGGEALQVVCSSRSSIQGALESVRQKIVAVSKLVGATCDLQAAYPGWTPDSSSAVVGVVREEMAGMGYAADASKVELHAIHAGLECGVLKSKLPGMDAVSFGPTITGAHSPDERIELATVKPFWELTLRVLQRLADKR
eukprot:TRINITY_DN16976_c0_g1_i2.p1 TRINITY_DN16976_c0_g1~~TRINITY_DN16976_c0_g1_i2.p1  ORF type:complete len:185 (-),score=52.96 TRINITY_DN16976_c0_g1_i2:142-696(-)